MHRSVLTLIPCPTLLMDAGCITNPTSPCPRIRASETRLQPAISGPVWGLRVSVSLPDEMSLAHREIPGETAAYLLADRNPLRISPPASTATTAAIRPDIDPLSVSARSAVTADRGIVPPPPRAEFPASPAPFDTRCAAQRAIALRRLCKDSFQTSGNTRPEQHAEPTPLADHAWIFQIHTTDSTSADRGVYQAEGSPCGHPRPAVSSHPPQWLTPPQRTA